MAMTVEQKHRFGSLGWLSDFILCVLFITVLVLILGGLRVSSFYFVTTTSCTAKKS